MFINRTRLKRWLDHTWDNRPITKHHGPAIDKEYLPIEGDEHVSRPHTENPLINDWWWEWWWSITCTRERPYITATHRMAPTKKEIDQRMMMIMMNHHVPKETPDNPSVNRRSWLMNGHECDEHVEPTHTRWRNVWNLLDANCHTREAS